MLILCGAPLGNPADASARLRDVLATADVVAAEDTRRLTRLARELDITVKGRIVSYFEGNEQARTPGLIDSLKDGQTVALITDGGMPGVSDPGYRLVEAAIQAGIPVTSAPGPSAVTTALALSGLPTDRFTFEGFPPRRPGPRRTLFKELAHEPRTMVFFEATHRLADTLDDMALAFGPDRRAALCRELTKTYEEVIRGTLASLPRAAKGEITLVIAGAASPQRPGDDELRAEIASLLADGLSKRDAALRVAESHGLSKRDTYRLTVSPDATGRTDAPRSPR